MGKSCISDNSTSAYTRFVIRCAQKRGRNGWDRKNGISVNVTSAQRVKAFTHAAAVLPMLGETTTSSSCVWTQTPKSRFALIGREFSAGYQGHTMSEIREAEPSNLVFRESNTCESGFPRPHGCVHTQTHLRKNAFPVLCFGCSGF